MKFKITADSPLYEALLELYSHGLFCEEAARNWVFGYFRQIHPVARPEGVLWGGIAAVRLPNRRMGWKPFAHSKYKLYEPTPQYIKDELGRLPRVTKLQLKEILEYGNYPCPTGINTVPELNIGDGYALVGVPDAVRGYEPLEGMEEILGSEYNRLNDAADEWRKIKFAKYLNPQQ